MPLSDLSEPAKLDLVIVAGDSFTRTLVIQDSTLVPINLTGLTGRAQIRARSGSALLEAFTVTIASPTTGEVTFALTATQTRALSATASSAKWDLELDGGDTNTHTILTGSITITPDITVL